jgi:hypothetical protein
VRVAARHLLRAACCVLRAAEEQRQTTAQKQTLALTQSPTAKPDREDKYPRYHLGGAPGRQQQGGGPIAA